MKRGYRSGRHRSWMRARRRTSCCVLKQDLDLASRGKAGLALGQVGSITHRSSGAAAGHAGCIRISLRDPGLRALGRFGPAGREAA